MNEPLHYTRSHAGGEAITLLHAPGELPAEPGADWFEPGYWGDAAQPVGSGGRGSAYFIDAPFAAMVLRQYRRGGLMARLSRDRYLWQGEKAARSLAEFRLLRQLAARGLPVPRAIAACVWRRGLRYRAAILLERLMGVRALGEMLAQPATVPWEAAGELVARFHREGLYHADLNAHNLLFAADGRGFVIDFDKCHLRTPSPGWQAANLARLLRSLHKLAGAGREAEIQAGFARLRAAYDAGMGKA